ncbi:hypothetical protein SK128_010960 [Halocaridina rubra]|uniref:Uncharacterized protein n=1 Tax=Halocaridina rubra TaxID=373956 RepID=A0AAN8X2V8_HALRR
MATIKNQNMEAKRKEGKETSEDGQNGTEETENADKSVFLLTRDFFDDTTLHGYNHLLREASMFRRVTWTVLCLTLTAYAIYQIAVVVSDYSTYPKKITREVLEDIGEAEFPGVTVCNLSPLPRSSALQKHGLWAAFIMMEERNTYPNCDKVDKGDLIRNKYRRYGDRVLVTGDNNEKDPQLGHRSRNPAIFDDLQNTLHAYQDFSKEFIFKHHPERQRRAYKEFKESKKRFRAGLVQNEYLYPCNKYTENAQDSGEERSNRLDMNRDGEAYINSAEKLERNRYRREVNEYLMKENTFPKARDSSKLGFQDVFEKQHEEVSLKNCTHM